MTTREADVNTNGEREKKNPFLELFKLMWQALIRKKEQELTTLTYDEKGALGKQLKELKKKAHNAKSKSENGDYTQAQADLHNIVTDFNNFRKTLVEFRQERGKAVDGTEKVKNTNTAGESAKPFGDLVQKQGEKAEDAERNKYTTLRQGIDGDIQRAKNDAEEIEQEQNEEEKRRKTTDKASRYTAEKQAAIQKIRQLDLEVDADIERLQREIGDLELKLKQELGEAYNDKGDTGIGIQLIHNQAKTRYEQYYNLLDEIKVGSGREAEYVRIVGHARNSLEKAYAEGELNQSEYKKLREMLERRELVLVRSRDEEGWVSEEDRVVQRRESEVDLWRRVRDPKDQLTARQAMELIENEARIRGMSEAEAEMNFQRMAGRDPQTRRLGGRVGEALDQAMYGNPESQYFGYTPDQTYQMAKREIIKKHERLDVNSYRAQIVDLLQQISSSSQSTYEAENRMRVSLITALLVNEDVLTDFGINEDIRTEMFDLYKNWVGVHEQLSAYWGAGDLKNLAQMAQKIEHGNIREMIRWERDYRVRYSVNEQPNTPEDKKNILVKNDVSLKTGDILSLMEYRFWAKKMLSLNEGEREKTKQQMVMYTLARQLDGFVDVDGWAEGMPKFEQIKFEYRVKDNGEKSNIIDFIEDKAGNKFRLEGLLDDNSKKVGKGFEDLMRNTIWSANFANGLWHYLGRAAYHDPLFKGFGMDWHRKFMDTRYPEMYGIAKHQEFVEAADHYYRDYLSQEFDKMTVELVKTFVGYNNLVESEVGEFKDFLGFMLKDRKNWMMSKEIMLENWQKLMVERKVTNEDGNLDSRWYGMIPSDIRYAEELAVKFLDSGKYDFGAFIEYFDDKDKPYTGNTKGIEGFKAFVERINMTDMYKETNVWDQRTQKYFTYLDGAKETVKATFEFFANPSFQLANELVEKHYPWMNRQQRRRRALQIWNKSNEMQGFRLKYHTYETDENNTRQINTDINPLGKKDTEGLDEMGRVVYKRKENYMGTMGRLRGWPSKRAYLEMRELNQLYASRIIDREERDLLVAKNFEWNPAMMIFKDADYSKGVGKWVRMLWTFDVGMILHDGFHIPMTHGLVDRSYLQWGVGSWLRRLRMFMSYMIWEEILMESAGQYASLLGTAAKEAFAEA